MPAWWGRKSSKTKEDQLYHPHTTLFNELNHNKSHVTSEFSDNNYTNNNNTRCPRSLEHLVTDSRMYAVLPLSNNSVRGSSSGSGGGGGCSSSGNVELDGERKFVVGHPLPRPITSTTTQYGSTEVGSEEGRMCAVLPVLNNANSCQDINGVVNGDGGVDQGHGVGSASVSSVSSSGSISNEPTSLLDHIQSGNFSGRGKSPGPGSRAATTATLIHPRLAGLNLVSPTQREEEERNQGHPLPLPPSSPTSPLSPPNGRSGAFTESTCNSQSKWKKGRLLGRGTFGHVYLGFNSEGGHMCAIKEVRNISDDPNSREPLKQLNQEINFLSQLSHPNIVRYYSSDLAGDTLSVYLEYVSGGSIHKLLQEYGPFKEPVIQNYTRQILSGLAYLHNKTTVHRDIKGANILVHPTGEIKLADFGMAKHITSCNSVLSFKGSPYWMAPEVVVNKNGYNLAVDIWSLGCTILEMAMAKPPWNQYEGVAAIFKIGNSKEIPEIPDFLSNVCKSFLHLCLKRDPADRPLASELLDHPFVKGQSVGRALNFNPANDAVSFSSDERRRKPQPLEIDPCRKSISSYDMDQMRKPGLMILEPRDNPRSITSLPVSPSSSPQHRLAPISCPARTKQQQFKQSFNIYNKKTRRIHT